MAKRHNADGAEKDDTTDQSIDNGVLTGAEYGGSSRRSVLKGAAAAAATLGTVGAISGGAAAQTELPLDPDGEVTLDPGEYTWDGSQIDVGSDAALVGGGDPGDVVVNLESGTMHGDLEGRLENIVVRGENPESKAGINVHPGATLDGFVWPEGGQQSEDRALYTPDGGDDRLTIRNSAWGWMANNGAYVDKPPVTMENCAAVNNNIAGIRVGHRDGTSEGETTEIRNSLVAVTADIPNDDTNSPNARGIRVRAPGHIVIENCYFIYLDVDGPANPIEVHDGAAGSTVEIRDCTFYNETDQQLVRDKSGGDADITVENCVAVGDGSFEVEGADVSESDLAADGDVSFPLPSDVTGNPAADEIEGVESGLGPWDGSTSVAQADEDGEDAGGDADEDESSDDGSDGDDSDGEGAGSEDDESDASSEDDDGDGSGDEDGDESDDDSSDEESDDASEKDFDCGD